MPELTQEQQQTRERVLSYINRLGAQLHQMGHKDNIETVLRKLAETSEKNPSKIKTALRFL